MVRLGRRPWMAGTFIVILVAVASHFYLAWRRGDDIRLPDGRMLRRFPCSSFEIPPNPSYTVQAFAVIDGAAQAAQSNGQDAVKALVDAVFDRELPAMVRCNDPLRHQVADAEWRFRQKEQPPIAEATLVDVANGALAGAGAPAWARVNIEELHFLRTAARPELPRFIGTVGSGRELSDQMSPVEAVFMAMELGTGMLWNSGEFRGGPDAYLQRARDRQLNPPRPGAVLRLSFVTFNLGRELEDQNTTIATAARRFLTQLFGPR